MSRKKTTVEGTLETVSETNVPEKINKSQIIRDLFKEGKTRAEIAKQLNCRYQQVQNVLTTAGLVARKNDSSES